MHLLVGIGHVVRDIQIFGIQFVLGLDVEAIVLLAEMGQGTDMTHGLDHVGYDKHGQGTKEGKTLALAGWAGQEHGRLQGFLGSRFGR